MLQITRELTLLWEPIQDHIVYIAMLDPLKKLGLDSHKVTKLGLKLHEHSVQYAYKLVSTRRALEKSIDNSRHKSGRWLC